MGTLLITEDEIGGNTRRYDILIAADKPTISQTSEELLEFLKSFKLSCSWERREKEGKCHPNAPTFYYIQVHSYFGGKVKVIDDCDPLTGINLKSFHFALLWTMRINGWTLKSFEENPSRKWTFERSLDSGNVAKVFHDTLKQ